MFLFRTIVLLKRVTLYRNLVHFLLLSHQVGGGTALDAVVNAVKVLEDDKWGNAGRGSVLNAEGRVEMDASVVDGR